MTCQKIYTIIFTIIFVFSLSNALCENLSGRTTKSLHISDKKIRVAVLGFDDYLPDSRTEETVRRPEGLPQELADMLIEHISQKKRYNIVEREVIRRLFNEKKLTSHEEYQNILSLKKIIEHNQQTHDETMLKDFGKIKNTVSNHEDLRHRKETSKIVAADYIILAKLTNFSINEDTRSIPGSEKLIGYHRVFGRLHLRIVDITQGIIIASSSIEHEEYIPTRASSSDAVNLKYFKSISNKAASYFNDVAFPAQVVSLNPLTINRGTVDRISLGTNCTVLKFNHPLIDENGIKIGEDTSILGEVKLSTVKETFASTSQDLEAVEVGDRVNCSEENKSKKSNLDSIFPTLAIVKIHIQNETENNKKDIKTFTDTLQTELGKQLSTGYTILERENLSDIFSENELEILFSGKDIIDITFPQISIADYLLFISISDLSRSVALKKLKVLDEEVMNENLDCNGIFRLVDTKTQSIFRSGTFELKERSSKNKNNNIYREISKKLAEKINAEIFLINQNEKSDDTLPKNKVAPIVPW